MHGEILAGTSGYAYKEWKPAFYPEKLAATKFLEHYASRLDTVEINNTFYRFPGASMLEKWRDTTPDTFRFAVKANQKITHHGRLRDVEQLTRDFIERCQVLGPKLGPILFQLPPNFKRDDERLKAFLDALPKSGRFAMEFRHASWFEDAVWAMLKESDVSLCVSEGDKLDTPKIATAKFCYLRLRREQYTDAELSDWREWVRARAEEGRDVYVYLKHDEAGVSPERALRLVQGG